MKRESCCHAGTGSTSQTGHGKCRRAPQAPARAQAFPRCRRGAGPAPARAPARRGARARRRRAAAAGGTNPPKPEGTPAEKPRRSDLMGHCSPNIPGSKGKAETESLSHSHKAANQTTGYLLVSGRTQLWGHAVKSSSAVSFGALPTRSDALFLKPCEGTLRGVSLGTRSYFASCLPLLNKTYTLECFIQPTDHNNSTLKLNTASSG